MKQVLGSSGSVGNPADIGAENELSEIEVGVPWSPEPSREVPCSRVSPELPSYPATHGFISPVPVALSGGRSGVDLEHAQVSR